MKSPLLLSSLFVVTLSFSQLHPNGGVGENYIQQRKETINTEKDGNEALGQIYAKTACGLNYAYSNILITARGTPAGPGNYSGTFNISGVPAGAVIDKAYLWVVCAWTNYNSLFGTGVGTPINASMTPPAGSNLTNAAMTQVGTGDDKNWGETATRLFRLDVTSFVNSATTKNGSYSMNLTRSAANGGAAVPAANIDGATLLIVYRDPYNTSFQGNMYINDGVMIAGPLTSGVMPTHNMTFPAACQNGTNTSAFVLVSDIQQAASTNGLLVTKTVAGVTTSATGVGQRLFYNMFTSTPTVSAGATTTPFRIQSDVSSGTIDFFGQFIAGLYFQTTCNSCSILQTNSFIDPHCAINDGSISLTSGGCAPTYQFSINNGSTFQSSGNFTGLGPGVYSIVVEDGAQCRQNASITLTDCNTLDVGLQYFNVSCLSNQDLEFRWKTLSEINNDYFSLESTTDGANYSLIDTINGAGTIQNPTEYTYRLSPLKTNVKVYYRLKQTDFDGSVSYFNILSADCEMKNQFSVFPNPTEDILNVLFEDNKPYEVEVLDINGKVIIRASSQIISTKLSLYNLSQGVYQLRILNDNETLYYQRLIKQ